MTECYPPYSWLLEALFDGAYCVDLERRITYWNAAAERLTGYSRTELLGRSCADNVLKHVNAAGENLCLTGCPLSEVMRDGVTLESQVFLHHKDGHRTPVAVRCAPLRDGAGNITGGLEIFTDAPKRELLQARVTELERLAFIDALTGVANRRFIEQALKQRLDEAARYGWIFGAIMLDIDHFKTVNDTYGHGVGDQALRMTALTLAHSVRTSDLVGRWGGEEFLILAPHIDAEVLLQTTERLRVLIGSAFLTLADGQPLAVTASFGATLARPGDTPASIIERADAFLYASKAAGRDRVTCDCRVAV